MCSSIGDRTRTPYFCLSNEQTSNPIGLSLVFTKLLNELTRTSFFRTSNELKVVCLLVIEFEHPILASNDRTSNLKPNRAFTRFTKLLTELTQASFFRTSNELKLVHLLAIKLKHPTFSFERSNFKHCSTHH